MIPICRAILSGFGRGKEWRAPKKPPAQLIEITLITIEAVVEPVIPRTAIKPTSAANNQAITICPHNGTEIPN